MEETINKNEEKGTFTENEMEKQRENNITCPNCGNKEWYSQIVQNTKNASFCGVFFRYLCCWPWALYYLLTGQKTESDVIVVCSKCGYRK